MKNIRYSRSVIPFKPLLTGAFLLLFSMVYSQDYAYSFQVEGITNSGYAKQITDIIRPLFNVPANPFKTFPSFKDNTDTFQFSSDVKVTREQLENALQAQGYTVTEFSAAYINSAESGPNEPIK